MHLLILGGTVFLGRHLVDAALARGHTITLFHRGRSNPDLFPPDLFPSVEHLHGDRKGSLDALAGRTWDAVIDTSGYHPRDVRSSAERLNVRVGRYAFISTISVYADYSVPNLTEDAPVARLDDPAAVEVSGESYGPLKTHCEDVVQEVYAERGLIIRPGLIVGPHDPTDRFTYWPVRAARGGEILAPQAPQVPVQYIDVRDLAAWTLDMVEHDMAGVFNATGPNLRQSMGELLEACSRVAAVPSTLTWVSPAFLAEHHVTPFLEMPLWVPPEMPGLLTVDCSRAIAAGLTTRATEETVRATLDWYQSRPDDPPLNAGLTPAREAELLAAWHAAAAPTGVTT